MILLPNILTFVTLDSEHVIPDQEQTEVSGDPYTVHDQPLVVRLPLYDKAAEKSHIAEESASINKVGE